MGADEELVPGLRDALSKGNWTWMGLADMSEEDVAVESSSNRFLVIGVSRPYIIAPSTRNRPWTAHSTLERVTLDASDRMIEPEPACPRLYRESAAPRSE